MSPTYDDRWDGVLKKRMNQATRLPLQNLQRVLALHVKHELLEDDASWKALLDMLTPDESTKKIESSMRTFVCKQYTLAMDDDLPREERLGHLEIIESFFAGLDDQVSAVVVAANDKVTAAQKKTQQAKSKRIISSGTNLSPNGEKMKGKVQSIKSVNGNEVSSSRNNKKERARDVALISKTAANGGSKEKKTNVSKAAAAASKSVVSSAKKVLSNVRSSSIAKSCGKESKRIDDCGASKNKAKARTLSDAAKDQFREKEKATNSVASAQAPKPVISPIAPTSVVKHCLFREDSSVLTPRPSCKVHFRNTDGLLTVVGKDDIDARLRRWDPFWKCLVDLTPCYEHVKSNDSYVFNPCRTSPILRCSDRKSGELLNSVAEVTFQLPANWENKAIITSGKGKAVRWGSQPEQKYQYTDGQRRLLLRMLPLKISQPKKGYPAQADCHLWPKGTFLQINGVPVPPHLIMQRKQQSHDLSEWKGMCAPLDLTPFISNPERKNVLSLVSHEIAPYAVQICLAEYRSPETLTKMLLSTDTIHFKSDIRLYRLSYQRSIDIAKQYVNGQTVVLDDDSDDDDAVSQTFQITCPISMTALGVPVRGSRCKHMQCVDLSHFLHTNSFPSGRRWKCVICDDFVSVDELVLCGLFERMVQKHGDEARDGRDKIEFRVDGSWILKPQEKKRGVSDYGAAQSDASAVSKRKKKVEEIILCD